MQDDTETRRHGDAENEISSGKKPHFTPSPRPRVSASIFKWLAHTASAKLAILKKFSGNVAELLSSAHVNYEHWQWPATFAVIAAEIIAAILLLIPRTVRLGAIWSAILLIGFSAFALYYVYVLHGEALECGCFGGIIASELGVKTALRNLALLIPALIVFFGYSRKPSSK